MSPFFKAPCFSPNWVMHRQATVQEMVGVMPWRSTNSLFNPAWLGMMSLFNFTEKLATASLPPFLESILD
jgi:hypothetical protein